MAPLETLLHGERVNAVVGWLSTGVLALAAVESVLTDALLWAGFTAALVAVTVLPAVVTRDWTVMVPWPLLLVAAAAVVVRAFDLYPEVAGYVALAAFALVAVVELDAFTAVEMSRRFAVGFAVLTTLAAQGLWIVAQYYSDRWLGTDFLTTQRELQLDIVAVTAVGMVMGMVFVWYFHTVEHVGSSERPIVSSR